jgi:hypothetical protein
MTGTTLKTLAVGFAAGVLTVAFLLGLSSEYRRVGLTASEAALKAECEKAFDATPDASKNRADIESKWVGDLPTIAAHRGEFPSCVRYVRALLNDPYRAQAERWELEELDRQDSSAPDLSNIESVLSSIESDLSRR